MHLKSGEATVADAEQLMDWRAKSPEHETAYREAVKCWRAIGRALTGSRPTANSQRRRNTKDTSRS